MSIHTIWHKFHDFLEEITGKTHRALYENLIGEEIIEKIEKYVEYNPEIKIVPCDDALHNSSVLVLVPHPDFGITVLFVPQSTYIQNNFFLYPNHYQKLTKALEELKYVYKDDILHE